MRIRSWEWSGLGICLATPFALLVLKGYWNLLRCWLGPWLGPCEDSKAAGWLTYFLGIPWSAAGTSGILSDAILLGAPLLNTILVYNFGRMLAYAWSPFGSAPAWKAEPQNNKMQQTRRG